MEAEEGLADDVGVMVLEPVLDDSPVVEAVSVFNKGFSTEITF